MEPGRTNLRLVTGRPTTPQDEFPRMSREQLLLRGPGLAQQLLTDERAVDSPLLRLMAAQWVLSALDALSDLGGT